MVPAGCRRPRAGPGRVPEAKGRLRQGAGGQGEAPAGCWRIRAGFGRVPECRFCIKANYVVLFAGMVLLKPCILP